MAVTTPICDFGWKMPVFELPDAGGTLHRLSDISGPRGTLVMFLSNHCPYVQAVLPRIVRDVVSIQAAGIGVVAVMSNDVAAYPDDAPAHMARVARENGFSFPYLYDADQSVARAYDAQCTPDFFGFAADGDLQYRGRLDASGRAPGPEDARRELVDAMVLIAETGHGPQLQRPSIGCSIKWKS